MVTIRVKSKSKEGNKALAQKSSLSITLDNPVTSLALRTVLAYRVAVRCPAPLPCAAPVSTESLLHCVAPLAEVR